MKRTVVKGFFIACLAAGMASVGSLAMADPATACTYDNEGAEETVATQNSFTVYRCSQETWWPVRTCPIDPRDGECYEH